MAAAIRHCGGFLTLESLHDYLPWFLASGITPSRMPGCFFPDGHISVGLLQCTVPEKAPQAE